MATKHYDVDYLQNTRRLLLNLKEQSYTHFNKVTGGSIVDLGCGSGNDVIAMAKAFGEKIKVIGIDHDENMLQQGKTQAKGMSNVEFILSEAFPLPFASESISGLRAERLVQHLKNSETVISDIKRVLVSEAPLVIVETDWHSLSFYTEFTEAQKKLNAYLTDVKVNNGFAARKLTAYLQNMGFRKLALSIHPFVINTLEEANEYFWIERILKEAAEKGYMADDEYKNFYTALQNADSAGYFSCSINLVVVSCIK